MLVTVPRLAFYTFDGSVSFASSAIVIRRLSVVSLSEKQVYCEKMAEATIMQFSLRCSPVLYLLAC